MVVRLKGVFPKGISPKLLNDFPGVKVLKHPGFTPNTYPLDLNWIAGFTNADGSFSLGHGKVRSPKIIPLSQISL